MGNAETKGDFRKAVIDLTSKQSKIDDTAFWDQFWAAANATTAKDVFSMITAADVRSLRENSPNNLATLCSKAVEYLMKVRNNIVPAAEHKKVCTLFHIT